MEQNALLYLQEIEKLPDVSADEESRLIEGAVHEDEVAREKLAEAHMKQVAWVAIDYWLRYEEQPDLVDLIQSGNAGLFLAMYHFVPNKDFTFWEYATWWVSHEIERQLRTAGFMSAQ